MNIIKKTIIILLILIPVKIKADCSNKELSRYKILSSYVETYYKFDENTKKMNITVYNLSDELEAQNINDSKTYTSKDKKGEIKINNIEPGQTLKIGIYPKDECSDYRLRTIYINLPYYNKYYNEKICKNNNNSLCSKWANTEVYTREQFVKKVEIPKQEAPTKIEPEEETKNHSILEFLLNYYIVILLAIIVIGIFLIYKLDKKNKFDF